MNTSFSEFLREEAKKKGIKWNADVKNLRYDDAANMWHEAGKSIVGSAYRDVEPELTEQLIKFLLRDKSFKGDMDRGILIVGGHGTGKTVYMKILLTLFTFIHHIRTPSYTGKQIEAYMRLPEEDQRRVNLQRAFLLPTFLFDDLGEELNRVMVYGTEIEIGKEILTQRYNEFTSSGSITFITTNIHTDNLSDKYGHRVESRMNEMFNFFALEGEDMRKGSA